MGLTNHFHIYLALEPCDMRKFFNGLAALAEKMKPAALKNGGLFLFTNKRRNRFKALCYDHTGVRVLTKRLEVSKSPGDLPNQKSEQNRSLNSVKEAAFQSLTIKILLGAGNRHDILSAPELIEGQTDRHILADKAYDSDEFRQLLREQGLTDCIPPKANRKEPASYNKGHYRHRHNVENFFQRIKEYRAVSSRFEKLAEQFFSFVQVAAILTWLRF